MVTEAISVNPFNVIKRQVPCRRRTFVQSNSTSLYRTCIRTVCRNIEYFNRQFDLAQLPWSIKTDLIHLNMRMKGFPNEQSLLRLLTSHVKTLKFHMTPLTDVMLLQIAEQCRGLQELSITTPDCQFTSLGLCNSIRLMENLQVLQIIRQTVVDHNVIAAICANCPKLKSLWINECCNVNDRCVDSLVTMPLVELNVADTKITDVFLKALKDSILTKNLRDICLRNCSITKEGLIHLNWTRLENVNIMGAPIDDLSFIPSNAVYRTLNWSI